MINDINLIPKSSKSESKKTILTMAVMYLCFALVVVFLGYFVPLQQRSSIKSKIAQKEEDLKKYANMNETYNNVSDTISELQDQIIYFEALKNSLKMSKIFDGLEENIPSNVYISDMSMAEGILTLTGVSPSYKEVARYMVKLRGLEYVNDVSFSNAVLEDEETGSNAGKELYDFVINVNLNMPVISLEPQEETAEDTNQGAEDETQDDAGKDKEGEAVENEAN